jgi:predicted amidohydrolase
MDFWGGAEILGPKGNVIKKAPYFEEAKVSVVLDENELRKARSARPTLRDTKSRIKRDLENWGK